jgi:hypothetical protein
MVFLLLEPLGFDREGGIPSILSYYFPVVWRPIPGCAVNVKHVLILQLPLPSNFHLAFPLLLIMVRSSDFSLRSYPLHYKRWRFNFFYNLLERPHLCGMWVLP